MITAEEREARFKQELKDLLAKYDANIDIYFISDKPKSGAIIGCTEATVAVRVTASALYDENFNRLEEWASFYL